MNAQKKHLTLIFLVLGAMSIPAVFIGALPSVLAWFPYFLFLGFVRSESSWKSIIFLFLAICCAYSPWIPIWIGGGLHMAIWLPITAGLVACPFLIDLAFRERLPFTIHWLLFPCGMAAIEIILAQTDYISAYVSPTNMLADFSILSPIAKVGTFLTIGFFVNALSSLMWTLWLKRKELRIGVVSANLVGLGCAIIMVYIVGQRSHQSQMTSKSKINVAMVAGDQNELITAWKSFVLRDRDTNQTSEKLLEIYNQQFKKALFRSHALIKEGHLDVIVWPEEAVFVPHGFYEDFQHQVAEFAKMNRVDLMVGYALDTGRSEIPFMENRAAYFDATGEKLFDYVKTKLVPGAESQYFIRGNQELPYISTSYGSVAGGICRDYGYPFLVKEVSQKSPSLFLAPTAWFHPTGLDRMGNIMRAMETGIPFVIANQSSGLVVDGLGKVLAEKHYAAGESGLRYAGLPIQ